MGAGASATSNALFEKKLLAKKQEDQELKRLAKLKSTRPVVLHTPECDGGLSLDDRKAQHVEVHAQTEPGLTLHKGKDIDGDEIDVEPLHV